ncbi:MAG: GtrA family protein [Pseudomonadota bacterium]
MSLGRLAALYTAFAIVATVANLLSQRASLAVYSDFGGVPLAILVGTAVGLVVKYVLDKRWIFQDQRTGAAAHAQLFGLYTLMGVATTVIFWGTEYGFHLIWGTDAMRELGAIIGLSIGYVTKYQLDKRYVFKPADPAGQGA